MTTTDRPATLSGILASLGSTADEVAESLNRAGITGQLNEPCSCAIANYVASQGYGKVAVALDETGYLVEHGDGDDVSYSIGTDGPVPDFIRAFDDGAFPHLISERA